MRIIYLGKEYTVAETRKVILEKKEYTLLYLEGGMIINKEAAEIKEEE